MKAKFKVGDVVATEYNYECNSGTITKVVARNSGVITGNQDYIEYLVQMDCEKLGDGFELEGNCVFFGQAEIYTLGMSLIKFDRLLNKLICV